MGSMISSLLMLLLRRILSHLESCVAGKSLGKCTGFEFKSNVGLRLIYMEEGKREILLATFHMKVRSANTHREGIPFLELYSIIYKIWHAFIAIPNGLLSPACAIIQNQPHHPLLSLHNIRTLLHELMCEQPLCKELVTDRSDSVIIVDASSFGVGRVVLRELKACKPTVL
ncbi:hypothetical protein ACHAW6_012076 [Cyclotella cf. meneghiniana]